MNKTFNFQSVGPVVEIREGTDLVDMVSIPTGSQFEAALAEMPNEQAKRLLRHRIVTAMQAVTFDLVALDKLESNTPLT